MPEIAEVETIKNDLISSAVFGQKIVDVKVYASTLINEKKANFIKEIKNRYLVDVLRKGKNLIFDLDSLYLLVHLKMTGHIFLKDQKDRLEKHEHIVFDFENGKKLVYYDPRRFGKLLVQKDLSVLDKLGPDILSKDFIFDTFYEKLKIKRKKIKTLLLDQHFIAGLGNIYVDEVLFLAKMHPSKIALDISKKDAKNLFVSVKEITLKAIKNRGTSLGKSKSNFASIFEDFGNNQNHLLVHTKKRCPKCFLKIEKLKINQRTSHFCKRCQKI